MYLDITAGWIRSRVLVEKCGVVVAVIMLVLCSTVQADWPMYRNDAARSGYSAQRLQVPLRESWIHRAEHVPQPAWPRSDRQTFDRAMQPVIAGGTVYFGDTVTGAISALDLNTGTLQWRFFTEGPIRFAPVVFEDRLFVTSDDGCLYALRPHQRPDAVETPGWS
jgi:hypothetical protein